MRVFDLCCELNLICQPLEVLELKSYLNFLWLDKAKPCLRVSGSIMELPPVLPQCLLFQGRDINHVSVLIADVLLIGLYEASLIEYLAVKLEFEGKRLAEIEIRARVIAGNRISVVGGVRPILTLSLVEWRVSHIDHAHPVSLG